MNYSKSRSLTIALITILAALFLGCACRCETKNISPGPDPDEQKMNNAFEKFAVIGSGRNFLTVMIDLPGQLPPEYKLYALILDENRTVIRKISGYHHHPNLQGKNHTWFHFFLYAPGTWINTLPKEKSLGIPTSKYIKFIVQKKDGIFMEKTVKWNESWGDDKSSMIADLPSPPDRIPGFLVLRDYTFLAKGDYRKPEGYYVEGKLMGGKGEWTHFMPTSQVKGRETEQGETLRVSQGWLELSTGATHAMQEAVSPIRPFIEGWWDSKGYFHPTPLKINH